jgi:hypothetical protein
MRLPFTSERRAFLLVVLITGLFYLLTIRPGHAWGDGFAMYILHAKSSEHTPRESMFLFAKPRLLALLTDRRASGYPDPLNGDELWHYCSQINVGYLIICDGFERDRSILIPFATAYERQMEEVYVGGGFHLYRVSHNPAGVAGVRLIGR